jgi:hypothetical protein
LTSSPPTPPPSTSRRASLDATWAGDWATYLASHNFSYGGLGSPDHPSANAPFPGFRPTAQLLLRFAELYCDNNPARCGPAALLKAAQNQSHAPALGAPDVAALLLSELVGLLPGHGRRRLLVDCDGTSCDAFGQCSPSPASNAPGDQYPYQNVVRLTIQGTGTDSTGATVVEYLGCSGMVLGAKIVQTAAHCLGSPAGVSNWQIQSIAVQGGYTSGSSANAWATTSFNWCYYTDYFQSYDTGPDMAVLKLTDTAPVQYYPNLFDEADNPAWSGAGCGNPPPTAMTAGFPYGNYPGNVMISSQGPDVPLYPDGGSGCGGAHGAGFFTADIQPGSSGGPVFASDWDDRLIGAVSAYCSAGGGCSNACINFFSQSDPAPPGTYYGNPWGTQKLIQCVSDNFGLS